MNIPPTGATCWRWKIISALNKPKNKFRRRTVVLNHWCVNRSATLTDAWHRLPTTHHIQHNGACHPCHSYPNKSSDICQRISLVLKVARPKNDSSQRKNIHIHANVCKSICMYTFVNLLATIQFGGVKSNWLMKAIDFENRSNHSFPNSVNVYCWPEDLHMANRYWV